MKTLRISDEIHRKLTATVGTLMAQTGKMQTYQDAIEAMLNQSVILPPELLAEIENFIETNKELGYLTKEDFMRDAIRFTMEWISRKKAYIGIPREQYKLLENAVKRMSPSYRNVEDFIIAQIEGVLKKSK
jgi:hypothetical protein